MTITAAVDGSSLGNPGPAGWAWVISADVWDAGGWPSGTNNMGELTAILELLRATAEAGLADEELHILADSQYAINCITKWMPGWKKRGWKKADKSPVKNREILEELDAALVGRKRTFEWVKGHAGHQMNELADDHARGAAEAYRDGRVPAGGPGLAARAAAGVAAGDSLAAGDEPAAEYQGEPALSRESVLDEPSLIATVPDLAAGPQFGVRDFPAAWSQAAREALTRPVTIQGETGRRLVLMDGDLAEGALRALASQS